MYENILIATDGSDQAVKAASHDASLARAVNAKVTVVTVTQPYHWFVPNMVSEAVVAYTQGQNQAAASALEAVAELARAAGLATETVHAEAEQPFRAIIDTAKAKDCDLIVMGSHGRGGISAIILGSETTKVLSHSAIPVLVCS